MSIQKLSHTDVQNVNDLVQALKDDGAILVREFHSLEELTARIQKALDNGNAVVFIPSRRLMRGYYNARGFIHFMEGVLTQLNGYRVLIEPNFYGCRLILAVGPKCADSAKAEDIEG